MRLGPLEIGLIILVVLLILVVTRMVRAGHHADQENKISGGIQEGKANEKAGRGRRLRILGIISILVGIILLSAGISLFKWVFWSYLWSFIVMAIGFVIIFISRKR